MFTVFMVEDSLEAIVDLTEEQVRLLDWLKEKGYLWEECEFDFLKDSAIETV